MNLKGFGGKRSWPNFKVPEGTKESHKKPQSVQPVSVLRFGHETSRIRSRIQSYLPEGTGKSHVRMFSAEIHSDFPSCLSEAIRRPTSIETVFRSIIARSTGYSD